jgi:hypothetical protein
MIWPSGLRMHFDRQSRIAFDDLESGEVIRSVILF